MKNQQLLIISICRKAASKKYSDVKPLKPYLNYNEIYFDYFSSKVNLSPNEKQDRSDAPCNILHGGVYRLNYPYSFSTNREARYYPALSFIGLSLIIFDKDYAL